MLISPTTMTSNQLGADADHAGPSIERDPARGKRTLHSDAA
jgi:hypothetical protein